MSLATWVAAACSFLALSAPTMANMPINGYQNHDPSPCGLFGGVTLSVLLTVSGCWAMLTNWRCRK